MRRHLPFLALLFPLAGQSLACDRAPDTPAAAVRDSAGVEIVTSERPAWSGDEAWRVGREPLLRIGVLEGDPAYQFASITGAARLDDGTVVVADAGAQEVRFFDDGGAHLATTGGTGAGPGEFTGLAGLGPAPGGGVWAYDLPLRRITWLDPDGAVRTLATLGPEPAMLNAVGALPDGSLVLKQLWGARAVAGATDAGLRRDPVAYVRYDGGSSSLDTVGLFPGREVHVSDEGGRGVMSTPPFARNAASAIRGDRLVVGSQETWELAEYAPDGSLARIVRLPPEDLAVEPGDVEAYIDTYVEAVEPERRPGLRRMLEGMPHPPTRPAYGEVVADRGGRLWVSDWAVYPRVPTGWRVIDRDGRWLGGVTVPDGFHPLDIGADWILGTERDDMDVEYVVVYGLEKTERGS